MSFQGFVEILCAVGLIGVFPVSVLIYHMLAKEDR